MTQWLKQSTAVTVKIGPFLDDTDGKTAETGLTISQADVRLSMNGGNMAQKTQADAATHDEIGWYDCSLDTTDTGTLGRLVLMVHESGALPVWHEYMVVPANVWDSMFSTDKLQVDAVEISGDSTAADNAEAFFDGTGYAGTNNVIPTVTTLTGHTAQTGDSYARLGAPAGASVSADIAAVKSDTAAVLEDTGTTLDTLIKDIPTVAEFEARTLVAADYVVVGDTLAAVTTVGSVTAEVTANMTKISGDATAADRLEAMLDAMPSGAVVDDNDPDPTTMAFETNLSEATNDHYNGAFVVFTSGALLGQSRLISDYDGTTKVVNVATAFTEAPSANDTFIILGRSE